MKEGEEGVILVSCAGWAATPTTSTTPTSTPLVSAWCIQEGHTLSLSFSLTLTYLPTYLPRVADGYGLIPSFGSKSLPHF